MIKKKMKSEHQIDSRIFTIQPMTDPSGLVFPIRVKYKLSKWRKIKNIIIKLIRYIKGNE